MAKGCHEWHSKELVGVGSQGNPSYRLFLRLVDHGGQNLGLRRGEIDESGVN
jgi:hypothetical protein